MNRPTRLVRIAAGLLLAAAFTLPAGAANWDHVHILAPNAAEAAQWYAKRFGGKAIKSGPFEAVVYGEILVKFRTGTPDTKGSAGSSIDHIGFQFDDFDDSIVRMKYNHTEFIQGPQPADKPVMAYILGPDGVKIETVHEPGAR